MEELHFNRFTLDANDVLTHEGELVPIPPKELQLLRLLLRHDGNTVSHETIEQAIWPRQTVGYASIARCVYSLRKILGDEDRTTVMTVPKRGYRFGLPICRTSSTIGSSVASKIAQSEPEAYAHIMEAQRRANTGTFEGLHQAVALLKSACEADPGSAVACSAIADCVMFQGLRGHILPAEAFEVGVASSERALRIDSELASAHAVRGWF